MSRSRDAEDCSDARFAMDLFTKCIAHADAKGGLLAAALAAVAAADGQEGRVVAGQFPPHAVVTWLTLATLFVSFAALCVSITFLLTAVAPRLVKTEPFNRYSLTSVTEARIPALLRLSTASDREQGWRTAAVLANIARRKYRWLRRAFVCWAVAAAALPVVGLFILVR